MREERETVPFPPKKQRTEKKKKRENVIMKWEEFTERERERRRDVPAFVLQRRLPPAQSMSEHTDGGSHTRTTRRRGRGQTVHPPLSHFLFPLKRVRGTERQTQKARNQALAHTRTHTLLADVQAWSLEAPLPFLFLHSCSCS